MPLAFLIVALIGALFTFNAYRPIASAGPFSVSSFFAGWLTSELPFHHIVWQAVATVLFIAGGALESWQGWVGLAITLVSWAGLLYLVQEANQARDIADQALADALGEGYAEEIAPDLADRIDPAYPRRQLVWPFRRRHRDVLRTRNLPYGPHGRRNQLDVFRHRDEPKGSPVLLQVHGGAWVVGNKDQQGMPLMTHLASKGWVCVAVNYRLSPRSTWPDHIVDVKRAIVWVKEHIAEYGGDPDFIVITGGSAGGHLCSLAALTPNEPAFHPEFEDQDTTVQGCVPFYGVYDFLNREDVGRADMRGFLEKMVFKRPLDDAHDIYDSASPMSRVGADAPPFFVIHGKNDTLVPVTQARLFVELLRKVSNAPVADAEMPGAQHAFEIFTSVRTAHTVRAVERFVAWVYSGHLEATHEPRPEPVSRPPDEGERVLR